MEDLNEAEKKLMKTEWQEFKENVSMKQLISTIDRSIKRRNRLYIGETEEETKTIQEKRERIQRWKPVKLIALTLYMLLPFFEKPGWCL